ncbi:MAG: GumC family protein [Terracidiphilus sp.]
MPEDPESSDEQTSQGFDIKRYVDVVKRRHLYFIGPMLAGWLLVWGVSWVMPPSYTSTTTIVADQPTVPNQYVTPNVGASLQDQLQSITARILSTPRLLTIIQKFNLYKGQGEGAEAEDAKVDLMRKDIAVALDTTSDKKQITGFTVSYSAHNPQLAQRVTSELSNLFVDENQRDRQQESEDTTRFLQNQLQSAAANLAQQDAAVQAFESKHQGDLPSQEQSNIQILSGLQSQLQGEQDSLNSAQQQQTYLQSLIAQYQNVSTPGSLPASLSAVDARLTTLNAKLSELSAQYTDAYPDVRNLKAEIADTQKLKDTLLASLKTQDKGAQPAATAAVGVTANGQPQDLPLLQLEGQLQSNRVQIGNRQQAIKDLQGRINQYQERLNSEPASAEELADLTRGEEQSQTNYSKLLEKADDSEMATNMVQLQQGERFTILDAASLPAAPSSPIRLKLCGVGVAAGLVLGLIVMCGMEFMDDRIYRQEEIKTLLPVSIIAEIPEVRNPEEIRSRKKKAIFGWAAAAVAFAVILAGSAFTLLHG